MSKPKEMVIVFRDREKRSIGTFVNAEGHGARMEIDQFISLVAEEYGNPASTLTIKSHETKLKAAVQEVIAHMKDKTREIAGLKYP